MIKKTRRHKTYRQILRSRFAVPHAPCKTFPTFSTATLKLTNRARPSTYQHQIRQPGSLQAGIVLRCSIIPCPLVFSSHRSFGIPSICFCPWSQRFTYCSLTLGTFLHQTRGSALLPRRAPDSFELYDCDCRAHSAGHTLQVRTIPKYITCCLLCRAWPQARGHINLVSRFVAHSICFEATEPCGHTQIAYQVQFSRGLT